MAVWEPVSQHCAVAASRKRDVKPALTVVTAWKDAAKPTITVQTHTPGFTNTMGMRV